MNKCSAVLAVLMLVVSSSAWSACMEAQAPELPNPLEASLGEMLKAQEAVRDYVQQQQRFLDCSRDGFMHNKALDEMYELAERYNKITRRFKARELARDTFTELALVSY